MIVSNQNDVDELKSNLSVVTNMLPEMKEDVAESKEEKIPTVVLSPSKRKQEVVKLRDGSLIVTNDISGQVQHVSKDGLVSSIRSSPRRRANERIATVIGRTSPYRRRERLVVEAEPRFRRHVRDDFTRYDDEDWSSLRREEERLRWEFENRRTRRPDPRRTRYREFPRDSFDDSPSLYDDNASSVSNRAVGYPPQQHHNHTREFESTMGHLDLIARERERMQRRVSKRRWYF